MADKTSPSANSNLSSNLLPKFYRTDSNKKFVQATLDQLVTPGTAKKINGFIGRQNSKASTGNDIFLTAADATRQNYQLEPGLTVNDTLGNTTYFGDYIDYINQLNVFGANTSNHSRINQQEFYSWDPHIDWDKFVNFQNYYWLPYGPDAIKIYGQAQGVTSTYTVNLQTSADINVYIFTPNGLSINPTIRLYRGQTYHFEINSIGNPFSIKTSRSAGATDVYTNFGLSNNSITTGTITFTVPYDAPNVLYYVSQTDVNLGGVFQIESINENTKIDIETDILGKKTYKLPDGTALSNGMKLTFGGNVTPVEYASGFFYVEGVGSAIKLINESILEIKSTFSDQRSVLFDIDPFDKLPFGDATSYAGNVDYITVNRASVDHNPWSRYNRWFHKSTIEASATYNGKIANIDQTYRAVRPIIEFEPNLKLFNFGTTAIADVDLIDTHTTDVFSNIEGTLGYNIDGVNVANGQRILFTADTDRLVKNKIYRVEFINLTLTSVNGIAQRQIHLIEETLPEINQVVLVKQGTANQGITYWFNGTNWVKAQQKLSLNQTPLFDIVDDNGVSYSNFSVYSGSTFQGTKLFSYKIGTGKTDTKLGFPLAHKNINNVGDIIFNFNIANDSFQYRINSDIITVSTNTGYLSSLDYAGKTVYCNGWKTCIAPNVQAAVRIYKNSKQTNNFYVDVYDDINNLKDLTVKVYVNGIRLDSPAWKIVDDIHYKKIVLTNSVASTDVVTIKSYAAQPINKNGYYEIPVNLQNNPLNESMTEFTLGEVIDHVSSIVDNLSNFVGSFPGVNNLRDLGDITSYGVKFIQHSGPLSLSLYHITTQSNNVLRSIEKSREDYVKFKHNFIATSNILGIDAEVPTQVNLILEKINKDKPITAPYYFSDMVPYGANIRTELTVVDYRIKTYPLSTTFNLDNLSNNAVIIYLNTVQLLYGRDYTFNDQGFVVITATLVTGDKIVIHEYDSTDGCFIPETPTKLGIWPKYEPKIYVDTTLVTPQKMIQGHDGSQTLAYSKVGQPNDFRDELILELEKRIFNNIKVKYDPTIFDMYDIIPSYNRTNTYSRTEFNEVLATSFYKWLSLVGRDFTKPLSYDRTNSFTFNYKGHTAPDGRETPGYWRGVYQWILDTDRPNLCPWEMLGFTIEPKWWTSLYGPAPYTSDNLVMWQDIADGVVKEPGKPPVRLDKFAKPFLLNHIPVDSNGNLVSPLFSNLASGVVTTNISNEFVFGDVSPIEGAWRRSSHYPFSVILSSMLLTPSKTFGLLLDRSRVIRNKTGQLIYKDTKLRITPKDIVFPTISTSSSRVYTSGIINYLVNYILSDNLKSYAVYKYDLTNMGIKLSHRIGAFTSKEKFNLLLDSRSPIAVGSVFIPPEDYSIILNSSSPTKKISYSGVIITKLVDGFEVKGYSKTQPYFKYYAWINSGVTINVGGISESFIKWTSNQQIALGKIVEYNGRYYVSKSLHTTSASFNPGYYQILASLPVIGGRDATLRKKWDRTESIVVPYGTRFKTIQEVVDFLLGHGEWLKDQGFIFDDFNTNLSSVSNWETSAREFMFWTTQNWSLGQEKWKDWIPGSVTEFDEIVQYNGDYYKAIRKSLSSNSFTFDDFVKLDGLSSIGSSVISLSPSANKITFSAPISVVDDIKNSFNEYEILKVDGTPIEPNFLNSYREDNTVSYSSRNNDGIYSASFYLIQKEQVVILNNTTMFNDTIYNPPSGYKQDRIKVSGYTSDNWNGSFNIPGFIFDKAQIQEWENWKDYALGDIVKYKEFYYSASTFLPGTSAFESSNWIKLDKAPTPGLLPNWSYKASQFSDFYSLDSGNFDINQQKMAQHLIGYQKRQYLENIIQDDVSEYKFYQGMIIEKGTQNVLNKLFDVLSAEGEESLKFYEEWAIRTGQYGASSAFENIEFILDESTFTNNPQGFELVNSITGNLEDFINRQTPTDVYLKPLGYNSNPWPILSKSTAYLRTAGYVRSNEVTLVLSKLDDLLTLPHSLVSTIIEGNYIWITFDNASWNVYRYTNADINVTNVVYTNGVLTITTDKLVKLSVGSYIGISQTSKINGFYKITSTVLNSFTVSATIAGWASPFTEQNNIVIYKLSKQRISSIDDIGSLLTYDVAPGELIWVDNNGKDKWTVLEYQPVYSSTTIIPNIPVDQMAFGNSIATNSRGTLLAISSTDSSFFTYDKAGHTSTYPWIKRQTIEKPMLASTLASDFYINPNAVSIIGTTIAMSADGRWLLLGSPSANQVPYRIIDGIKTVDLTLPNTSLQSQGAVSLYEKSINNIFSLVYSFVSPAPASNERFGESIAFGDNVVYISAPGYNNNTGRVYKFNYEFILKATAVYTPVGTSGLTIGVSNTTGITAGMTITGAGFTKGQTVVSVNSLTSITISALPNSDPEGTLSFSLQQWQYKTVLTGPNTNSLFGKSLSVSLDSSVLLISTPDLYNNGSVVVYKNDKLMQRIVGNNVDFSESVTVSNYGDYIAISDPLATVTETYQGKVFIYKLTSVNANASDIIAGNFYTITSLGTTNFMLAGASSNILGVSFLATGTVTGTGTVINTEYTLYQELVSNKVESGGLFGKKIAFLDNFSSLAIYSKNGDVNISNTFDNNTTILDNNSTKILSRYIDSGRIDIFDRYYKKWIFAESLINVSSIADGYGYTLQSSNGSVFVSSPTYVTNNLTIGKVQEYKKTLGTFSWNPKHTQIDKPDVYKIRRAFLYNKLSNDLLTYLDVIDPVQGKIPGIADEEITYKTFYDPAFYFVGTATVNVDDGMAWTKSQVGQLWWDLRTAKFLESDDNDVVHRNSTWNTLAVGASIDIYEWVETKYLPDAWDNLADTDEGVTLGISGKSLYGSTVYSLSRRYDNISQTFKNTYFFWVKNKKNTPNATNRSKSASDVASLIANPRGNDYKYLALTSANSFSLANVTNLLNDKNVVLSVEYWLIDNTEQNIHTEWKIINDDPNTQIPATIEQKWFDSLCGKDDSGRLVPDPALPPKLRYGIENRPRQGMFVNRFEALKQFFEQLNLVLKTKRIVEERDISKLDSYDTAPSIISGLYDTVIDTDAELRFASVGAVIRPILTPIITDGFITGINIIEKGRGYLIAPYIEVVGSGVGAKVRAKVNTNGQIIGATIINKGQGYNDNTSTIVRDYSVLVTSDSQSLGSWAIYSYDPVNKIWSRLYGQMFDVRKYWEKVDWYEIGYSQFSKIDYSVNTFTDLNSLSTNVGNIVKIRITGSGTWILLKKYANINSIDWTQSYSVVGIEKGTIQFNSSLYYFVGSSVGFDGALFDGNIFDNSASTELRLILNAIKTNILIDDLQDQYLKLFFTSVRYALSEQTYVDWIFKTSFVKAQHNVGALTQSVTYRNDNLTNFEDYISEVKPYRTQVREYVSAYSNLDTNKSMVSDFDLPPVYEGNKIIELDVRIVNDKFTSTSSKINEYPWKNWLDNVGFVVTSIELVDQGSGYQSEPIVKIDSNSGSDATARAFIANGKVNRIVLLTRGSKYLSAPTITLSGGLSNSGVAARAIAIIGTSSDPVLGNNVIRSSLIKMKFDRTTQSYFISQLQEVEEFIGTGSRKQFNLSWSPDTRVGVSSVTVDGVSVLGSSYTLSSVKSTSKGFTTYVGSIKFNNDAPAIGAIIKVTYLKNWDLLNAADRIQFYYNPTSGQVGKDLSQLMTGIDYGGVIVNGIGFDIHGGWGDGPWYSDKWDGFDSTFDDYIVTVAADTHSFTLPYTPEAGTEINFYHIQRYEKTYVSDGITLEYKFNFRVNNPLIEVSQQTYATGVTKTAVAGSPSSVTLVVNNTTGIEQGMYVVGTGLQSGQQVIGISNNGTTLTLSAKPSAIPTGSLTFTFNYKGVKIIKVTDVTGIQLGDIVTNVESNSFGYGNYVTGIDTVNHTVTLAQIIFDYIPVNDRLTFTRNLTRSVDYTTKSNGTLILKRPITLGNTIHIIGQLESFRIDSPIFQAVTTLDGTTAVKSAPFGPTTFDLILNGGVANTMFFDIVIDGRRAAESYIVMTTPVANGATRTFTIPTVVSVAEGDTFILRRSTSDGSVNTPEADYDTALSGGEFGVHYTATGLAADDIIVDGDDFVSPTTSPAPEEVVPGQVVDAVAIKVYDKVSNGSASIKISQHVADGVNNIFDIGQIPNSKQAIIVRVISGTWGSYVLNSDYYTVDYRNSQILVSGSVNQGASIVQGDLVSIYSFGFNGTSVLDLDYYIGNGTTLEFVTKAPWVSTVTSIVYIDGVPATYELFKTDSSYEAANRIGIRFGSSPLPNELITFVIVSGSQQSFAVTKTEKFTGDGTTLTFNLENVVGDSLPIESSMLVRINDQFSPAPNNSYFTISNNRLNYQLDITQFAPYSIEIGDIAVIANGILLKLGVDYTVDLSGIKIKINRSVYNLYSGKSLIVSIRQAGGYLYILDGTTPKITFPPGYAPYVDSVVEAITSYRHDILDIKRTSITVSSNFTYTPESTEFYNYRSTSNGQLILDRTVIDDNYVWITDSSNYLLVPSVDYKLLADKKTIQLTTPPTEGDVYSLITFGSNILTGSISYMQFKDMLNRTHFKRLNADKRSKLSYDLHFYDKNIVVDDGSVFDIPNPARNKPGVIEIHGERIEYFSIIGNTLGQLRRGTLGTGVASVYKSGSYVQDIGPSETIPYNDDTIIEQIVSDGSNTLTLTKITPTNSGNLEWITELGYTFRGAYSPTVNYAVNNIVSYNNFYYKNIKTTNGIIPTNETYWEKLFNIPTSYGQSNDIEVFVGGYDTSMVWTHSVVYNIGDIVNVASYMYRCVTAHTSVAATVDGVDKTFFDDLANWQFFIGNIRLKKLPYVVHNINQAQYSPEGDVDFEPDFAVNGTNTIRLTNTLGLGTQVTVVKRTGYSWDSGLNILYDDSKIARFLKGAPGIWYSELNKSAKASGTFDSTGITFDSVKTTFDRGI